MMRFSAPSSLLRTLLLTVGLLAGSSLLTPALAEGVRAEIGKPLQAAGELLKAGKGKEALAKVREADAVGGKTAHEQLTIDRMKGAAAMRAGDYAAAAQAFEAVFPKLSAPAEKGQTAELLAGAYAQAKDVAKASHWAQQAQALGNNSASIKQLLSYLQSQSGDFNAIARDAAAAVNSAEQAGRKPDEGDLLRLIDAYKRTKNPAAYTATEKLVSNYPKKEYWRALIGELRAKPGFSDRLALDLLRIQVATGNLEKADDYMETAQLAMQAGLHAEGKKIVEKGYAVGALGTGDGAARHKRLKDLAVTKEAEQKNTIAAQLKQAESDQDGNGLVLVGQIYASLGEAEKGVELIEKGIAKGKLKRPEDAKLRLGQALYAAKNKTKGSQVLRSVEGKDGTAEVARLWSILANQQQI